VLWQEGLYRRFANRREQEQGISKSGNARLRTTMIEAAWLWLRHQPKSALSLWFKNRVKADRGRHRRVAIVALARKLLIAFWRFATDGEIPEGLN
jgi:transposase